MTERSELNKEIYKDIIEIIEAANEELSESSYKGGCHHWGRVEMSLVANHVERRITKLEKDKAELVAELYRINEAHKRGLIEVTQCQLGYALGSPIVNPAILVKYKEGE